MLLLRVQLHSFACGIHVFSAPFLEEIVLSPTEWCWPFCWKSVTTYERAYFCDHYSISLYVCLCQYHTVLTTVKLVNSEIRKCESSTLFFYFKNALAILESLEISRKFYDGLFYFCKKNLWGFDENCNESVNHFG